MTRPQSALERIKYETEETQWSPDPINARLRADLRLLIAVVEAAIECEFEVVRHDESTAVIERLVAALSNATEPSE
jgi:hypothetical protein